jgi:acyl-CoA synthetase (AMP-forming)/AMP-acid ligase II
VHEHLASYKVPRAFVFVPELVRAPSGKADYRWASRVALEALSAPSAC